MKSCNKQAEAAIRQTLANKIYFAKLTEAAMNIHWPRQL